MKSSNQVRIQQAFTQQAPRPLAEKTADFTIELKTIVKIYDRIYARYARKILLEWPMFRLASSAVKKSIAKICD